MPLMRVDMTIADFQNDQWIVINRRLITQGWEIDFDRLFETVESNGRQYYAFPLIVAADTDLGLDIDLFREAFDYAAEIEPRGPMFFNEEIIPLRVIYSFMEAKKPDGLRAEAILEMPAKTWRYELK